MKKLPPRTDSYNMALALQLICGKWKIAIIWELMRKRQRYGELRAQLAVVSEGVLINKLKELEADGIIRRIDFKEVPPHVEYELTDSGLQLRKALVAIEKWGEGRREQNTTQRLQPDLKLTKAELDRRLEQ